MGLNAMLVLGTKTTFLALGVTLVGVGGWTLVRFFRTKAVQELARFGLFLLASGFLFGLFSLLIGSSLVGSVYGSLTFTGEYIEASGVETALLSGRTTKLLATWREFQAALPQSLLFGLGRGTQATVVEMDLAEIFLYYGLPGGAALCWVYASQGVLFLRGLFRRLDLRAWCCVLSLGLAVGYLCLAGHTLFSVTSGFYFALTLLYARRFTGESPASPKGAIA